MPYFKYRFYQRDGIWQADGRANKPRLGRYSLDTSDEGAAMIELRKLDHVKAVEFGFADPDSVTSANIDAPSLDDGMKLYMEHVRRPSIVGGASQATAKRYRAVFKKAIPFFAKRGLTNWSQISARQLKAYAAWLEDEEYAPATEFLELTTLKQVVKLLVENGQLGPECTIKLRLAKPRGTDTYCWKVEEVEAMLQRCNSISSLQWLGHVITGLACTGLRISELACLQWSDIDQELQMLTVKDESGSRHAGRRTMRTTKGRRSRSLAINDDLKRVLADLKPLAKSARVFLGPNGENLKPDVVRRALISDVLEPLASSFPVADGDIGFLQGRLHSFRHFFCSVCAAAGVSEQVIMRWLGHQSSNMVRHYFHLHDQESQRQMAQLCFVRRSDNA